MLADGIVRIVGKKWTIQVLQELSGAGRIGMRFNELRSNLEPISSKVLAERLKELVEYEMIAHTTEDPATAKLDTYVLTEVGNHLVSIAEEFTILEQMYFGMNVKEGAQKSPRMSAPNLQYSQQSETLRVKPISPRRTERV